LDITPRDRHSQKAELRKRLVVEKHIVFETIRITKSGEEIPVENHARTIDQDGKSYFLIVTRDISERKRAEANLKNAEKKARTMEKLAIVGEVTSGIAHDLRNPLNVISNAAGLIELLVKDRVTDPKMIKSTELLKAGVEQTTKVINRLMGSIREPTMEFEKVYIPQQMVMIMSKIDIPKNVQLVVENREIVAELPPIMADSIQLERVFLNLMKNAIEAMPKGGAITIRPSINNGYIRIEVTDTGTGISPENIESIFEPLFTTKAESGGTGIGLSVCRTIIEAHSGTIEVESEEGKGTKFIVQIPLSSE
jgi:two-component system sporulation sensor kinase A